MYIYARILVKQHHFGHCRDYFGYVVVVSPRAARNRAFCAILVAQEPPMPNIYITIDEITWPRAASEKEMQKDSERREKSVNYGNAIEQNF